MTRCTQTPGLHNDGCDCPPEEPLPDRTRHEWRLEALEADGTWVWVSSAATSRYWAGKRREGFLKRCPDARTRIVRVTTTHTIEP